ncbi:MAG: FAD-dependent oxidoreductase [Proteobacteria bacterium]|nr:FAD-dependent oxidoreductase [Pseudomonadota bacterium]
MTAPAYDVVVIGSGIAGLTAAKKLAATGLKVANIEATLFGGLVTNINELEGAYEGSGADLASGLMMEVADLGCDTLSEVVTGIERDGDGYVVTTEAAPHPARAVIVASGARLKRLHVPGEAEFEYKGVSHCADCDGPMYQDQDVVVIGGGDSALQEARVLSHYCRHVYIVHRGAAYTAGPHWIRAVAARDNVTPVPDSEVVAITGSDMVEAVTVVDATGATRTLPCTGVFPYIGLEPMSTFLPEPIVRDAHGAVVTDDALETAWPGVYAAGAVRAGYGGTLDDAVQEARRAADAVIRRLQD